MYNEPRLIDKVALVFGGSRCESAYDLTPNRLPIVTLRIASPEDVTFA
jgi:hypothetical protein